MYKVIYRFADLLDSSKHIYEVGDAYPRKGVSPSSERLAELMGSNNKIGRSLIEEVKSSKSAGKKKRKEPSE